MTTKIRIPGWEGFCVEGDVIWTPAGQEVHKHQIDHFWWLVSLLTGGERYSDPLFVDYVWWRLETAAQRDYQSPVPVTTLGARMITTNETSAFASMTDSANSESDAPTSTAIDVPPGPLDTVGDTV